LKPFSTAGENGVWFAECVQSTIVDAVYETDVAKSIEVGGDMTETNSDAKPTDQDGTPQTELLLRWLTNCRRSQIANYTAAKNYLRGNYYLGVPAVLFSAIVGTSVFAALGTSVEKPLQILVGIVSVLAAVLGALQTFLRWGELASKCRATAAEYGGIKRQIEQLLVSAHSGTTIADDAVSHIREQMDTLARDAPDLPAKIWDEARRVVPYAADERRK
jgi:hypothetical protein